ncbi:MAG: hypothetical protein AABX01_02930 [Candidatus Micrarchaeota archaeon]
MVKGELIWEDHPLYVSTKDTRINVLINGFISIGILFLLWFVFMAILAAYPIYVTYFLFVWFGLGTLLTIIAELFMWRPVRVVPGAIRMSNSNLSDKLPYFDWIPFVYCIFLAFEGAKQKEFEKKEILEIQITFDITKRYYIKIKTIDGEFTQRLHNPYEFRNSLSAAGLINKLTTYPKFTYFRKNP